MVDAPYAIIVLGNGTVQERRLADHLAGQLLPPSVTVVSNTVQAGRRTVVLTRPVAGASPLHYTFNPATLLLTFINAIGASPDLSYHQVGQREKQKKRRRKEKKR